MDPVSALTAQVQALQAQVQALQLQQQQQLPPQAPAAHLLYALASPAQAAINLTAGRRQQFVLSPALASLPGLRGFLGGSIDLSLPFPEGPESVHMPKGYIDAPERSRIELTAARLSYIEQLETFMTTPGAQAGGFIPSGPEGVGKTTVGLLLVSWSFARGYFVVPMFRADLWFDTSPEVMAHRWLSTLICWNADLLAAQVVQPNDVVPPLPAATNALAFAMQDALPCLQRFRFIFSLLANRNLQLLNLVDEHQSLQDGIEGVHGHALKMFLHPFRSFAAVSRYSVFIGSAHSRFERSLSGGDAGRVVRIDPCTENEAMVLVTDRTSNMALPAVFWAKTNAAGAPLDAAGNVLAVDPNGHAVTAGGAIAVAARDAKKVLVLQWHTGWLPRELVLLSKAFRELQVAPNLQTAASALETFRSDRATFIQDKIERMISTLQPAHRGEFNESVMCVMERSAGRRTFIAGFFDRGFILKCTPSDVIRHGTHKPVSGLAASVLSKFASEAIVAGISRIRMDDGGRPLSSVEQGLRLERMLIAKLHSETLVSLPCVRVCYERVLVSEAAGPTPQHDLKLRAKELVWFGQDGESQAESIAAIPAHPRGRTTLYVPRSSNFTAWDAIYCNDDQFIFIQVSATLPDKKKCSTMIASLSGASPEACIIIDRLLGIAGTTVACTEAAGVVWTPPPAVPATSFPAIHLAYFYGGNERLLVAKPSKTDVTVRRGFYKDLLVVSAAVMESSLGIRF